MIDDGENNFICLCINYDEFKTYVFNYYYYFSSEYNAIVYIFISIFICSTLDVLYDFNSLCRYV